MRISVLGNIEQYYKNSIENIINLFAENAEIIFEEVEEADFAIYLTIDIKDKIYTTAQLNNIHKNYVRELPSDESLVRNQSKYAMCYVLLKVLEEHTGIKQSWGILTGIRPTKLMHRRKQAGIPIDEIYTEFKNNYLLTEEKIQLMDEIVDRQLSVMPDLYDLKDEVSIYIGIPFCPTKCAYCTFPAYAIHGRKTQVDDFLVGLHKEIKEIGELLQTLDKRITTVYFGGGTPTSISAEQMDLLYEQMYKYFPHMENVREITVEAGRPDTIAEEKINVLKKWKVDRISVNPQSYHDETLRAIGRHHSVQETIDKFKLSKDMGMDNINMDLIIGLPGEDVEIYKNSLKETEKLMPTSLTVHTLSFKRASEMTKNKNKYLVASREEVIEMMKLTEEWTRKQNYHPYYLYRQKNILGNLENVGYAMEGFESIYNIIIMEEVQTIIGLGCGASSKFIHPETGKIDRFANPKDPRAYNESYDKYIEDKKVKLVELFK